MFEKAITSVIENPSLHPLASSGLLCASILFRGGVALRHSLYKRGVLKKYKAPLPVVSVGNIVAGGTGKTPFVEMLARDLAEEKRVAILTRGYRGGDEAKLLYNRLKMPIYIGKNRCESAKQAHQDGNEVVILDDGMQHLALRRDIEIVVVHGDDPFGKNHFLPRGYLREEPEALGRADIVVISHAEKMDDRISRYTDAPIIGTSVVAEKNEIEGKRVALFCGIGKPECFVRTVEEMGARVVHKQFFPDHVAPTHEELKKICEVKEAEMVVCTEKDWVKIPKLLESPIPVTYVGVRLSITFGEENYRRLIERIVTL